MINSQFDVQILVTYIQCVLVYVLHNLMKVCEIVSKCILMVYTTKTLNGFRKNIAKALIHNNTLGQTALNTSPVDVVLCFLGHHPLSLRLNVRGLS